MRNKKPMANGWLHLEDARAMNYAAYSDDDHKEKVLIWVIGHGVQMGTILETRNGLKYVVFGFHGDYRCAGWQPAPRSPNARRRA